MEYEKISGRQVKDSLYEEFARIGKVLSHAKRLELLNLLAQGERSVEELASEARLGVTTASAHLQVMRQSRLVERRKAGTRVYYRLANDAVYLLLRSLQDLAETRLTEVQSLARAYFESRDELEPIARDELLSRIETGEAMVIDVRPLAEFEAGHIPGARSIPLEELSQKLAELPADAEIVAYCRGPYCVLAPQALEILHAGGRRARRLQDGFPEWRLAGLPVEAGS